jgi:hypothetical protein
LQWGFLKIHVEEEEKAEDQSGKVTMVNRLDALQKTTYTTKIFTAKLRAERRQSTLPKWE